MLSHFPGIKEPLLLIKITRQGEDRVGSVSHIRKLIKKNVHSVLMQD